MRKCLRCGGQATHTFYAERLLPNGQLATNLKPYPGRHDFLLHNRERYICQACYPMARQKLENMSFRVEPMKRLPA